MKRVLKKKVFLLALKNPEELQNSLSNSSKPKWLIQGKY